MSEKLFVQEQSRSLGKYLTKCFALMGIGIFITAIVAYVSYITDAWMYMYVNQITLWGTLLLEIGVVIFLSARLYKMSVTTAYLSYFAYAIITGYTFGSLAVIYDLETIGISFGFTALLFVNMAIIGAVTKHDLSKYRSLLMVGLMTLVITSIMGLIFRIELPTMIMSYIGIGIFLCLTAFDTQMIQYNYQACGEDQELLSKMAIYSALELYLDFVNIFLYILRLFGKKD